MTTTVRAITEREAPDPVEERLRELGAHEHEIAAARTDDRLTALAIELLISPTRAHTLREIAKIAGAEEEDALRLWRAWGFPAPDPDDARFSGTDGELLRFALDIETMVGRETAFHTARVMGLAVSRIAEAEASMLRSTIEAPLRAQGLTDDAVLAAYEGVITATLAIAERTLAAVHRHHLVEIARRQLAWGVEASADNVLDVVVGFADLTASTRLAAELDLDALDHALATFEEQTADVIATAGATLVKRIGDAVMFTTPAPAVAAEVATTLVERFSSDPLVPPVRAGLAAGQVVARRGDFYGLPVALAARLQGATTPSSILVDATLAARLVGDAWALGPPRTLELAGFTEPVTVHTLGRR